MHQTTPRSHRLFMCFLELVTYVCTTIILLRFICPALISAKSDLQVIGGFSLIGLWLVASAFLVIHLFIKGRKSAATHTEKL